MTKTAGPSAVLVMMTKAKGAVETVWSVARLCTAAAAAAAWEEKEEEFLWRLQRRQRRAPEEVIGGVKQKALRRRHLSAYACGVIR